MAGFAKVRTATFKFVNSRSMVLKLISVGIVSYDIRVNDLFRLCI